VGTIKPRRAYTRCGFFNDFKDENQFSNKNGEKKTILMGADQLES